MNFLACRNQLFCSYRYHSFSSFNSFSSSARRNATSKKDLEKLSGIVSSIIFSNETTGYVVGRLRANKDGISSYDNKQTIFTAHNVLLRVGMSVDLEGRFANHSKFGHQFQAQKCITQELKHGSTQYTELILSSGLISGVGPAIAKRIVDELGDETEKVLREGNLKKLVRVNGIGKKKGNMIINQWKATEDLQKLVAFLQKHEIPVSSATNLSRTYGNDAIAEIERNPYQLIRDVPGYGFLRADALAKKLGIEPSSPLRIHSLIQYCLSMSASLFGHCYLKENELFQATLEYSGLSDEENENIVKETIDIMLETGMALHMRGKDNYYLPELYWAEFEVANALSRLMSKFPEGKTGGGNILDGQDLATMNLSEEQRLAVETVLNSPLSVLRGGPGTGKTYCLHAVVAKWKKMGKRVLLASPTARAAKRLEAATNEPSTTIHRLLGFKPPPEVLRKNDNNMMMDLDDNGEFTSSMNNPANPSYFDTIGKFFEYNDENKLETDAIVIDETSMLDIRLAAALLAAIPDHANVLFVGDGDQLPSVGPGQVFKDLIESDAIPCAVLKSILRQEGGHSSKIAKESIRVNKGDMPQAMYTSIPSTVELLDKNRDHVIFFEANSQEEGLEIIQNQALPLLRDMGLDPYNDLQVLSPMNRGLCGAHNLNQMLQNILNLPNNSLHSFNSTDGTEFRIGDRVMQIRNDYNNQIFNGDTGIVKEGFFNKSFQIPFKQGGGKDTLLNLNDRNWQQKEKYHDGIVVEFEEVHSFHLSESTESHFISFPKSELARNLRHSYACTVHKSQGSEYPAIILPIFMQHYPLLQRNMFYTGLTRAKKIAIIVGQKQAIRIAIKNNQTSDRNSFLQNLIVDGAYHQDLTTPNNNNNNLENPMERAQKAAFQREELKRENLHKLWQHLNLDS